MCLRNSHVTMHNLHYINLKKKKKTMHISKMDISFKKIIHAGSFGAEKISFVAGKTKYCNKKKSFWGRENKVL